MEPKEVFVVIHWYYTRYTPFQDVLGVYDNEESARRRIDFVSRLREDGKKRSIFSSMTKSRQVRDQEIPHERDRTRRFHHSVSKDNKLIYLFLSESSYNKAFYPIPLLPLLHRPVYPISFGHWFQRQHLLAAHLYPIDRLLFYHYLDLFLGRTPKVYKTLLHHVGMPALAALYLLGLLFSFYQRIVLSHFLPQLFQIYSIHGLSYEID